MSLTLGQRIRVARQQNGWSQAELGERVGVSSRSVVAWEADASRPELNLVNLARALLVPVEDLMRDPAPAGGPLLSEATDEQLALELLRRARLRR